VHSGSESCSWYENPWAARPCGFESRPGHHFCYWFSACLAQSWLGFSVDWEHPTQNTDESEIPLEGDTAIERTLVEWGTCDGDGFGNLQGFEFVAFPDRTTRISNDELAPDVEPLKDGRTYCVRAFTENHKGKRSDTSQVVPKVAVQL